jgi:UDP-2,4-diacetamido-2,4,6-trideoxy-beta-L-altropyranose hydrolase
LKRPLVIRADASPSIGTGHIMRMIALGQAWQHQGREVVFLCAELTPAIKRRLESEGFPVLMVEAAPGSTEDMQQTRRLISQSAEPDGQRVPVILDGYQFGSEYQAGLQKSGVTMVVVDDYGYADRYHADYVLNQNLSARECLYKNRDPGSRLLLGPRYAMLRREFLAYRGWTREVPPLATRILVTMGGADPENVTLKVARGLLGFDVHVKVVVGGSNPNLGEISKVLRNITSARAEIEVITDTTKMPELMAWADMAVSAGGSTTWELAFMGLPTLVVTLAKNQEEISRTIHENGLGISLGWHHEDGFRSLHAQLETMINGAAIRRRIASTGREMVDGDGACRVLAAIAEEWQPCEDSAT